MYQKTLSPVAGRLVARLAVVAAGACGVVAAVAAPSAAALPGLERVTAFSANNSSDKGVTAACPSGKQLIGATYIIGGASQSVVVDEIVPNGSTTTAPTSVRIEAYESDPFEFNWTLRADAFCVNPLPGLVRASFTGANSSADAHAATAECPTGKVMTGGGYQLDGARGEAVVDEFRPSGGSTTTAPRAMFVTAYEEDPYADDWELTAFAICANPLSGLMVDSATSATNANDNRNVVAVCPAGRAMTSAGHSINGATGEVALDDFVSVGDAAGGVTAIAGELDPLETDWTLTAYIVCASL